MDGVQQPHREQERLERKRRTLETHGASSSFSMNLALPLPLKETSISSLFPPSSLCTVSKTFICFPPLLIGTPSHPLPCKSLSQIFIALPFPSPCPSVSASPPTILSVVVLLSPHPLIWAGLEDAEGLSLSLSLLLPLFPSFLSACLRLTGS